MLNHKVFTGLLAILAVSVLFLSPDVTGDNKDVPPEHTHTYPNVYGVCFCPDPAIFMFYDDDCTEMTIEGYWVFVTSKACTHGVWQPPPPQHDCGCAATVCGATSCGCYSGSYNGGIGACPCEDPCSSS